MRKKTFQFAILILLSSLLLSFVFTYFLYQTKNNSVYAEDTKVLTSNEENTLNIISNSIVKVAETAKPAVVYIEVEKWIKEPSIPFFSPFYDPFFDFFDDFHRRFKRKSHKRKLEGLGSGFIVDAKNGYVITNNHVIDGADKIKVTLWNGKKLSAKVVGTDPKTDIGVLKLEDFKGIKLHELKFADSDKIKVGQWAIAVGNPFGLKLTVTFGIISAKGRANMNIAEYEDFIQTDAAINPGNSGGPLLDINGRVIGMNTAIFTKSGGYQGIGFAVPSNMIKSVMRQLVKNGKIKRGRLGVIIQNLNDELKKHFDYDKDYGVLVSEVMPDSSAEKAGIKAGDIIMEYDGNKVLDVNHLKNMVGFTEIGKKVKIKIFRDGKVMTVTAKITEQKGDEGIVSESKIAKKLGVKVKNAAKVTDYDYGVIITSIDPDGAAAYSGLKKGDIILQVNRVKVKSKKHFFELLKKFKDSKTLLFLIDRNGYRIYFVVKVD